MRHFPVIIQLNNQNNFIQFLIFLGTKLREC